MQVTPDHYDWKYSKKDRWASYWHQIDEVMAGEPKTCLEIGVGSGVVTTMLRRCGVSVTTVDIDDRLGADRVGSVLDLPAADREFEVVLCAQVLEHLPWDQFPMALAELARVAERRVVISLPQSGRSFKADIVLPIGNLAWQRTFQTVVRQYHAFDGQHYWQVGSKGSWPGDVRTHMKRHFVIEREYIVPENLYHRFYVLRPHADAQLDE